MSNIRSGYEEIDVLRDVDGVVAVISRRVSNGQMSFMIGKEFDRDGKLERTAFIQPRHAEGAVRLAKLSVEYIAEYEDRERTNARITRDKASTAAGGAK